MPVRPHRPEDAGRIGEILAAGWRQAYAGFMPTDALARRIDANHRRAEIAAWLADAFDPATEALFVADEDGVAGFIHMELGDKGDLSATGCVNLLYVDPPMQGRGIGRALMRVGARWLIETAPGPLALSAYANNPFRHAYAAMDGREAKHITVNLDGHDLGAVLYVWSDPRVLL